MKKTVCFFVREFPVLSQTFVIQQINGLIFEGHSVSIASLYLGEEKLWDSEPLSKNNLRDKTTFLLPEKNRGNGKFTLIRGIIAGFIKLLLVNFKAALYTASRCRNIVAAGGLPLLNQLITISKDKQKRIHAEAVVAHFGELGVFACLLSKTGILTSNIFTVFHGYEISEYKTFERWKGSYLWLSHHSTKLLPISKLWSKELQKVGVENDKLEVLHMGIDLDKFKFNAKPSNSKPIKILTVARAVEKKGLTYSINGVSMCKSDFEYNIIGDGPLLENLKQQASQYDNKEKFIFHGPKAPEFVAHMLSSCDIFILTSVTALNGDMEGIPVSLMEAMATGAVVLSTFHSGIPELIDDKLNGFLVPEKDSKSIALKVDEIAESVEIQKIKEAALIKVNKEFNQKKLDQQLSELIQYFQCKRC